MQTLFDRVFDALFGYSLAEKEIVRKWYRAQWKKPRWC